MKKVLGIIAALLISIAAEGFAGNGDLVVDGNLGIGSANIGAKLQVVTANSAATNLVAKFLNPNISQSGVQILIGPYTDGYMSSISAAGYPSQSYASDLWLRSRKPDSTLGNGVYISPSDSVGIGTTAPQNKLHIYQPATDAAGLIIQGNTINTDNGLHYVGMTFDGDYGNASGNNSQIRSYSNLYSNWGSSLAFLTTNLGGNTLSEKMRITASGNVGIGKMDPQHALDVNGEVWANDLKLTSDERFKKNITPVQNALTTVLRIEGVSYEWKKPEEYLDDQTRSAMTDRQGTDKRLDMISGRADGFALKESKLELKKFPEGRHYGVLAQAVEKVLPEIVSTDLNGEKAVAYSGLLPVLIEAIKEQQKMIEKQQAEIVAMRKLIEKL